MGADLYLPEQPSCPAGGVYSIGTIAGLPTCTLSGDGPYDHVYALEVCPPTSEMVGDMMHEQRDECSKSQLRVNDAVRAWRISSGASADAIPTWDELIDPRQVPEGVTNLPQRWNV